jgi:hypothetical protein
MSTMMDDEDYRIREAIRIFKDRPKRPFSFCACLGPAKGEPTRRDCTGGCPEETGTVRQSG